MFLPGPGRDLTDVVMEAKITVFDGFCDADLERDGNGEIQVELTLLIEASRGPANQDGAGQLAYFVALAIPVRPGVSGADIGLLIGFQLTEEEIQYNLNNRG